MCRPPSESLHVYLFSLLLSTQRCVVVLLCLYFIQLFEYRYFQALRVSDVKCCRCCFQSKINTDPRWASFAFLTALMAATTTPNVTGGPSGSGPLPRSQWAAFTRLVCRHLLLHNKRVHSVKLQGRCSGATAVSSSAPHKVSSTSFCSSQVLLTL